MARGARTDRPTRSSTWPVWRSHPTPAPTPRRRSANQRRRHGGARTSPWRPSRVSGRRCWSWARRGLRLTRPKDLPLTEDSPIASIHPYALSKIGEEAVAIEASTRHGFPVVVTRSFNHTGPGQRPVFVVPALARRVISVQRGEVACVHAGNVDVRRDLTDVRDVVRGLPSCSWSGSPGSPRRPPTW